jgi:hypothetical protein
MWVRRSESAEGEVRDPVALLELQLAGLLVLDAVVRAVSYTRLDRHAIGKIEASPCGAHVVALKRPCHQQHHLAGAWHLDQAQRDDREEEDGVDRAVAGVQ